MRALRALVVVMGVLLAGGVVALVTVIASRFAGKSSPPIAAISTAPRAFGSAVIDIPAGAVVSATVAVGDRLVLHLALEDGGQRLLVVDPGSGALLGTIDLRAER